VSTDAVGPGGPSPDAVGPGGPSPDAVGPSPDAGGPAVRTVVVDFDGTICPADVSDEIFARFGGLAARLVDLEYERGDIGSRECLMRQAMPLRGRIDEMAAWAVRTFPVEPSFGPFVDWARDAGMAVVVVSDGLGFHVGPILEAAGVRGLQVVTNVVRTTEAGPRFGFRAAHPSCTTCGTCKMLAVTTRRRPGPVAFVGDGHSDRYGAFYADLVFAKSHLALICAGAGVPFCPWETFADVRARLEDGGTLLPGPLDPVRCPGWRAL
jgi:2-hydroxy-3-keto-5-methylthiopentenyl-1-phosphate phosphatase